MYTVTELKNLLAIIGQASGQGVGACASIVALYSKTQKLIEDGVNGGNDVSDNSKQDPDTAA